MGSEIWELMTKAGYGISEEDKSGVVKYYGYITTHGNWYIMKNDSVANTYRYAKGDKGYATAWTGRAGLTYSYFNL